MKTLLLMRHAEASARHDARSDQERPLSAHGRSSATQMGRQLGRAARSASAPWLILSSPARRALETAELLRARLPEQSRLRVEQSLYLADLETMLSLLHQLDPMEQQVLVLGHNPGTAMLASWLCGTGEAADVDRMKRRFPPAALAAFELEVASWRELDRCRGRLLYFALPEEPR